MTDMSQVGSFGCWMWGNWGDTGTFM